MLVVDLAIIAFFIATPLLKDRPSYIWFDIAVAALLVADMLARALAASDPLRWLRQPTTLVDVLVLVTLLLPAWLANLGFLRILEAMDAVAERRAVAAAEETQALALSRAGRGAGQHRDLPVPCLGLHPHRVRDAGGATRAMSMRSISPSPR